MRPREAIVCVDDEPLVLNALRRSLRTRLGRRFKIEMASNGAEALELIEELGREQTTTRMVVSDVLMPVMDGYELVRRLHEERPEVLKVIVTGYADPTKLEQLTEEAGLLASFDKPWSTEELCDFIEESLQSEPHARS